MSGIFLSPDEIKELTGIRTGSHGKTREQLQATALKSMKVPHYVNAAGRPVVARAVIEGGGGKAANEHSPWEPKVA